MKSIAEKIRNLDSLSLAVLILIIVLVMWFALMLLKGG